MSERPSRKALLKRGGIIAVVEPRKGAREDDPPEDGLDLHVCLTAEGRVFAFSGHVDLGTGIRTALAQMVAEELDFPVEAVEMALGDTAETPDQGPTIASETIQVTSRAMRIAATQIRHALLARAASALQCDVEALALEAGVLSRKDGGTVELNALLANERILLPLAREAEFKPVERHKLIGTAVPRVDIPAKVDGRFVYVHDVRVPGMLHGRVVRPPYAGLDAGDFVGRSLISVDRSSVADIPGVRAVVVEGDFVGVVAEREEQAAEAALKLKTQWREFHPPDLSDVAQAIRAHPATPRVLLDKGDVERALGDLETRLDRTYVWPYQMHGSIGPSCAVADMREDGLTVWTGSQNPHRLLKDLALLTGLPAERIEVIRHEAAGCYGRNCADDVVADAVLLSKAVGAPVRVQLTREQEHLWEPKGAAQLIEIKGGLGAGATLKAYDFHTWYPSNDAPTLALLLTGRLPNTPSALKMGDRTAAPGYAYENMRLTAYDMAPIVRASWLRGVSAMPNVFAHESYIDELAHEAGVDPVAFRLRHINDERAARLVSATAERAGWAPRTTPRGEGEILRGRGFAQARYVHGNWPGVGAAWAAWVAEVAVNRATGEVTVSRVVVGQDTGMMVNPAGVTHQIHGNVLQSTSRVLREEVTFSETTAVASRDWGSYPVLTFPELPAIDVLLVDRQSEPPLGAGESASVPSAAAIANAVFDATGVRFREMPLTPERVLAGLGGAPLAKAPQQRDMPKRASRWRLLGAAVAGAASFAAVSLAFAPSIAPIARPDPSIWSAATLEHGRQLAALGDCAVCHTAKDGTPYAGGLALATPFGVVMTTNITPDVETGVGAWSYPAFARAMRDGIHRDGRHLYPAFPYPSFAKTDEADLQALYAFLMSQPAVRKRNETSRLTFPFNLRPLMAGWNLLFNRQRDFAPDPSQSAEWNRGRYLVDGLGHCGACHTPRNLLGAERSAAYLAGGEAEGWEAPALTGASLGPIPWSEAELYRYLKTGASPHHGAASGPMAPVVEELREMPDADIRAMAAYLGSFSRPLPAQEADALAAAIEQRTGRATHPATSPIARLYEGACAACHETGRAAPLANAGPALGLSTKVQAATAANFVNLLIEGGQHGIGSMPSFATALDDRQIADLARYVRARFAPRSRPWRDVETAIARARAR